MSPIIDFLCKNAYIIALQETWIFLYERNILDNVIRNFASFSLSAVDLDAGIVHGRPHGGASLLWDKSIAHQCKIVNFDDSRLLGQLVSIDSHSLIIINEYLPYYCNN